MDKDEESLLKFGLLITRHQTLTGTQMKVVSENEGINNAEVLLIVETWLEKAKNAFKQNIDDNML